MKPLAMSWLAGVTLVLAAHMAVAQTASAPLSVVHFETGASWDKSLPPAEQRGFPEHSANRNRLRNEGEIVFGARYGDVGMIFVKADSLDAAKAVIDADPGVRAGIFSFRVAPLRVFYPWRQP